MSAHLSSDAVVFEQPGLLELRRVSIRDPKDDELVIDVQTTGISTGTEKLLWDGTMPAFPGLAYPLVPGYEAVGVVRSAGKECTLAEGSRVFVPGADCYQDNIRGLFGASASCLVVPERRVSLLPQIDDEHGVMLALAATAMHVLTRCYKQVSLPVESDTARAGTGSASSDSLKSLPSTAQLANHAPDLIVGHGVLGRLLARICLAIGANAPVVWEIDKSRRHGAKGYQALAPDDDDNHARQHIVDVSGAGGDHIDRLIGRLARHGRLTLAGFYQQPVNFNFPPAFMREVTLGVCAEWQPEDLATVLQLVSSGRLDLSGLVTHRFSSADALKAYPQAFGDPDCLKATLTWSH